MHAVTPKDRKKPDETPGIPVALGPLMRSGAVAVVLAMSACDAPAPYVQVGVDLSPLQIERTPTGVRIDGDVEVSLSSSSPTEVVLDVAEVTLGDEALDLSVDASEWPVATDEVPVTVEGLSVRVERDEACAPPSVPVSLHVVVRGSGGARGEGYFSSEAELRPPALPLDDLFPFAWKTTGSAIVWSMAWYQPSVIAASDDAVLYRTDPARLVRASKSGLTALATDVTSFARGPDGGAVALVADAFGLVPTELRRVTAEGDVVWSIPIEGAGDGLVMVVGASDGFAFVSGRGGTSLRVGEYAVASGAPFLLSVDMADGSLHRAADVGAVSLVPGLDGSVLAATASFDETWPTLRGLTVFDDDLQAGPSSALIPARLAAATDGSIAAMVGGDAARVATGSLSGSAFALTERAVPCLQYEQPGSVVALAGGGAVVATSLYGGGTHWVRLDENAVPAHDAVSNEFLEIASSGDAVYVVWTSSDGTSAVGRLDRATIEEVLP